MAEPLMLPAHLLIRWSSAGAARHR